jgi:hypothetical protein
MNYVNATYTINNSADGKSASFSFTKHFMVEILQEQQRLKISLSTNVNDTRYSQRVITTSIDSCKISKGVATNFFTKVITENMLKVMNSNYTCPYPKNFTLVAKDCVCTDKFLPPLPTEKRFKVEVLFVGMIKGKHGWQNLYWYEVLGRFKRE